MIRKSDISQIHKVINDLIKKEDYTTIDFICNHINLHSFCDFDHIDIALSFLTATLPIKTKLQNRNKLVTYIEIFAPENEVDELLEGLR